MSTDTVEQLRETETYLLKRYREVVKSQKLKNMYWRQIVAVRAEIAKRENVTELANSLRSQ